jgi:predicted phage baseplate assembly protein
VGTDAIAHVAATMKRLVAVRNLLPARGGVEQESVARVRADAPWAFRTQERAVMLDDYARAAEQHPDVLRAAAALRWTGSWSTVFVAVETRNGKPFDDTLREGVIALLDRYRMAGTDVEVEPAHIVPVELALQVRVDDTHRTEDVRAALYAIFTDQPQPGGTPGLFDPNTMLMGAPLYLSPFVAAARNLPGVAAVDVTRFARADLSENGLAAGYLVAHRTEVFALRNNPDFPERGTFALDLEGGR